MNIIKYILPLLFISMMSLGLAAMQPPKKDVNLINNALNLADVHQLAYYMDSRVSITFGKKSTVYSKGQAEVLLGKYFRRINATRFKMKFSGIAGADRFGIGILYTNRGKIGVYFRCAHNYKNNRPLLKEVRFE